MPEHHHHHHHHYHERRRDKDRYAYRAGEPGPGPNPHRLRRSVDDRWIAGVCGGIAEYLGWDPAIVRVLFVGSMFFGFPAPLVYIVLWFVLRPARVRAAYRSADEERFWRTVSVKPKATFGQLKHKFRALDARIAEMEQAVVSEEYGLRRAFRDLERGA